MHERRHQNRIILSEKAPNTQLIIIRLKLGNKRTEEVSTFLDRIYQEVEGNSEKNVHVCVWEVVMIMPPCLQISFSRAGSHALIFMSRAPVTA